MIACNAQEIGSSADLPAARECHRTATAKPVEPTPSSVKDTAAADLPFSEVDALVIWTAPAQGMPWVANNVISPLHLENHRTKLCGPCPMPMEPFGVPVKVESLALIVNPRRISELPQT